MKWVSTLKYLPINYAQTLFWLGDMTQRVFDYDAAVRDEERPGYLLPALHCGDGLHPNDAGGAVIAAAVDLPRLLGFSKEECPNEA